MHEWPINASMVFRNANRFIAAYHTVLQPVCKRTGLPPLAVDILLFFANNTDKKTAKDVCLCLGCKPGIVSIYVDRLVNEGLLERQEIRADRRKTRLVCTQKAQDVIEMGREQQRRFAQRLLAGLSEDDVKVFHGYIAKMDGNISGIIENGV